MNVSSFFGGVRFGNVIIAITLQVFVSGCVAYQFSTHGLLSQDDGMSGRMLQSLVLGVEAPDNTERSYNLEKFIDNLNGAGVFKAVGYLDRLPTADLVLRSFSYRETSPQQACLLGFEGQLLTIFTIGLLPQICNARHEGSFRLYSSKNREQEKLVSFSYETRSILGWVALLYLPSPNWSVQPLKEQYPDLLKAVFAREAKDIERLVK
ncbi:MAG: hypothetical protein ACREQO_18565 [Candidatus Binatia bacterium]